VEISNILFCEVVKLRSLCLTIISPFQKRAVLSKNMNRMDCFYKIIKFIRGLYIRSSCMEY